jgi:hypothetical protein
MPPRILFRALSAAAAMLVVLPAFAQSGIQMPREMGLDPTFARGWLAPDFDRFGFVTNPWRDVTSLTTRNQWSYRINPRSDLGMSYANGREFEAEQRQMSLYGRYWFSPDWALSAESMSRDTPGLLRLQDFRIGVHRRF